MKKSKSIFFIAILCLIVFILYLLIYTTLGSKFLFNRFSQVYLENEELEYKDVEGNLNEGVVYQNLEIKDIKGLPEGTVLKIQRLYFSLTAFNFNGVYIEIENARLRLPDSDPIVISGTFQEKKLDLDIYSKGFTVNEVLSYIPDFKNLIPLKGDINDIDLQITGDYLEPVVKGSLVIENFIYKGFLLTDAPLSIDIQLKDVKKDVKLFGHVDMEKGELSTKRVVIDLEKGGLTFSGPWNEPHINFNGKSKVEKTKINIVLKGTVEKPELSLSSEPAYSTEKLMIMLATGKSWQSVEDSIDNGLNSAALTKDFIDYFFFAGKSNQFARKFGISDFSITLNEKSTGIAVKKEITESLEVGYGIEQKKENGQITDVSKTIGGKLKVSEGVSVGVERESSTKQANDLLDEQINNNNDKVFIEYKKSF